MHLRGHRALEWNPEHLTPRMRVILIEWLSEVCRSPHYRFSDETLHRAVHLCDAHVGSPRGRACARESYQLLGCVALMLAAKAGGHDLRASEVEHLCAEAYCRHDVLDLERELLCDGGLVAEIGNATVHAWYTHLNGGPLEPRGPDALLLDLALQRAAQLRRPCALVASELRARRGAAWDDLVGSGLALAEARAKYGHELVSDFTRLL